MRCLLALALAVIALGARAAGGESLDLAPRLAHYALRCHAAELCRIDCFQNGVNVVSRLGISGDDRVSLVVSTGLADEFVPRWIEIRAPRSRDIETLLLGNGAICDLQSLSIEPVDAAR